MNFIELTNVFGEKQIINIDKIIGVFRSELTDGGVGIALVNGKTCLFKESYEKLREMLLPCEINFEEKKS